MPGCLAPGCTSGYKSNYEKVHFFTVPKDDELRKKWQIALKRPNPLVYRTQVVCEKHFLSKDILKIRELLSPEGDVVGVSPYKQPRLAPGAVPCLFPWTELMPSHDIRADPTKLEVISIGMEEPVTDPLEISKEPELIKEAQTDIAKLDLLVCGECNEVFHFVEELNEHKTKCTKQSKLKLLCEKEDKSQVWGFILWKNMQLKKEENSNKASTPWIIYQRWCKLDENEKNLWINAGQNIQGFHKIATASLHEVKVVKEEKKTDKDPLAIENSTTGSATATTEKRKEQEIVTVHLDEEVAELIKKGVIKPIKISTIQNGGTALKTRRRKRKTGDGDNEEDDDEDEEFVVEKILAKRYNPKRKTWEYEIKWQNYVEETWEPLAHLSNCKELIDEFEERIKTEKEKILTPAPRGRGRPRSTPAVPGSSTPGSANKVNSTPVKKNLSIAGSSSSSILSTPDGKRPTRTSKQKALNQVKQWCGNISDSDETNNKRPFEDDDDSDGSFEKKLKLDAADSEDTDYEEGLKNTLTTPTSTSTSNSSNTPASGVKKTPKVITYGNGSMKKLPSNVLIPDAKGVVRISHKQLPSLSSGVYIMSKTSGIIKLDPAASKLATSGGQTILKVTPKAGQKIGQAHIKLIKRTTSDLEANKANKILKPVIKQIKKNDEVVAATATVAVPKLVPTSAAAGNTSSTTTTAATSVTNTPTTTSTTNPPKLILNESISSKFPSLMNNTSTTTSSSSNNNNTTTNNNLNDDSDDGIEEMEFPTDLPLPEPDSPPGDFVLDPITGKIAGQVYPTVSETENTDTNNVDNIVKLAAADITEDDLKNDNEINQTTSITTTVIPTTTTAAAAIITTGQTIVATTPSKVTVATPMITTTKTGTTTNNTPTRIYTVSANEVKKNPSILNTAIANSNILQKTLLNPSVNVKKKVQPRVLNQSVAARPSITVTPVIRSINTSTSTTPNLLHHRSSQQHQQQRTPVRTTPKVNVLSKSTNNDHRYGGKVTKRVVHENVIYKKTTPTVNRQNSLLTTTTTTPSSSSGIIKRTVAGNSVPTTTTHVVNIPATTTGTTTTATIVLVPTQQNTITTTTTTTKPAVISMPSLNMDDEPLIVQQVPQQQQQQQEIVEELNVQNDGGIGGTTATILTSNETAAVVNELPTFSLADTDKPMFITGDDGTIYQVAGQNEEGQTILVTQDSNGQQQCLLVTSEALQETTSDEQQQTTLIEAQAQQEAVEISDEQPVVAQFIRTEPPSPGGTHKVVVMLPDGDVIETQVTPEEYASLALDK